MIWGETADQSTQDWRIVSEVVEDEDEHHQLRVQMPHEFVIIGKLIDLACASASEGRGENIQAGQMARGQVFEPDMKFVGDRDFPRFHEGIADHGDVTTCRGKFGSGRFAVEKPQVVGSRDRPEIEPVRRADFRIRFQDQAHFRVKILRNGRVHERRHYPEPNFSNTRDHRQPHDEQQHIPANEA